MSDEPGGDAAELDRLRAEVEQLREENARLAAVPPGEPVEHHRGRVVLSVVLVVVASLLVPAAILGVWLNRDLTDTDRYVETVSPLVRDADVQAAAKNRIIGVINDEVDIDSEVEDLLPDDLQFLSAPITSGVNSLIDRVVTRVLASDQFATLWDTANRAAHDQVVSVLTNSADEKGVVQVDLSDAASQVGDRLSDLGLPFFDRLGSNSLTFTLVESEDVATAQSAFNVFERLAAVLPWIVLGLYAAAVFAHPRRRRGLIWASTGLVLSTLLLLITVAIGRGLYLDALPTGASISANETIFDTLTRFLRGSGRTVLALGLVVLVAALLSGPSGPAVGVRRGISGAMGSLGGAASGHGLRLGAFGSFVARNLVAMRVVIVVLAVVFLIAQSSPSAGSVLWTSIITVVLLVLLEFVGRAANAPPAESAEGDLRP